MPSIERSGAPAPWRNMLRLAKVTFEAFILDSFSRNLPSLGFYKVADLPRVKQSNWGNALLRRAAFRRQSRMPRCCRFDRHQENAAERLTAERLPHENGPSERNPMGRWVHGAPGAIRTRGTRFRRAVLCPLSYGGVPCIVARRSRRPSGRRLRRRRRLEARATPRCRRLPPRRRPKRRSARRWSPSRPLRRSRWGWWR